MHSKIARPLARSLVTASLTLAVSAANAQLEEVVVTAQKRTESLQQVPISVTAISGERIADFQIGDLTALSGSAPNVQITHFANTPHGAVFNIRGMGVIEPDPYAGQTVTTVVDGVPLVFNMLSLLDLYDIERIEVHRGPQGTLFGANTTGGVINVVTRQPTGELGGDLKVNVGDYNQRDIMGSINFPITENLSGKITAANYQRDGFVTNVVNGDSMGDKDVTIVRGYLRYDDGETLDATFIAEATRSRNGAPIVVNGSYPGEITYVPEGTVGPDGGVMYESVCKPGGKCRAPNSYKSANNSVRDVSDQDVESYGLTINKDLGWGKLTSITGYKNFELYEETDQDGTVLFIDDTQRPSEGEQFSQELRATIPIGDSTEIITGVFYQENEWDHIQNFRIPFAGPLNQVTTMDWENWSVSAFAHAFIDISDRMRLQVGGRFAHEETDADVDVTTFFHPGGEALFSGGVPVGNIAAADEEQWDNWAAKIGIDYDLNDDMMLYAFASRGFKSGGFTGRLGVPEDIGPYDEETVQTVEVGIKSEWFNNRVRVNASSFFNAYDDLQLALIYFCTDEQTGATINCNSIINAAEAETWGLELEVEAVPTDGLLLTANLGYLNAEYTDFPFLNPVTGTVEDLSGEDLQNSPDMTASLGLRYEFSLFSGTSSFGANYRYTDTKYLGNLTNSVRSEIQSMKYIDANLTWTPASENWRINIWGTNLADERYIDTAFEGVGFIGLMSFAAPRQYGASFEYFWN
ncbi:TonB-dependent receptor [Luminiphilus syltensis NOR5-1B]|uniref:TonB-dependent receptor n=1 Tax=Luminiphilus syltensis NOR5-1B TaxID=565045 RepID=B8KV63_9GAMM|nr:TonB-dependent receptor [Luminiphilus syltensis]EED35270.1 TonB-dependent receptor [Luminiphilus syltensis NOR5-1B]